MKTKKIIANWKMNLLLNEAESLMQNLINQQLNSEKTEIIIAPPFVYLQNFINNFPNLSWASQNCAHQKNGALTGEISADILASLGVKYCIIGHSERRQYFFEDSTRLKEKVQRAWEADLGVIFCIGESLEIYEKQETLTFLNQQLTTVFSELPKKYWKNLYLAYEPIWSIGTGKIPTTQEIDKISIVLKTWLKQQHPLPQHQTSVFYGGSCNTKNIQELTEFCPSLDGFLVGGASLISEDFIKMIQVLENNCQKS